jgi:hypothetical protein
MIDEMTDTTRKAVLRSQFTEVLSRFREIDVGNEHQIRIDAYNGYAGTRQAREILIEIMAEINGLSPQLSDPTVSEEAVSDETVAEPTVSEEAVSDQTVAEPTVSEPTASEPTASEETVYLSNSPIDLLVRGSNYRARVFITVWDETGRPVTKAVVQGQWSLNGKYINEVSGSSNKEGIARLISNRFSGRPGDELTLIITDVVKHGYSYDFVLNIADDISVDLP